MPPTQMISWVKPASFGDVGTMGTTGSLASPSTSVGSFSRVLPLAWCQPCLPDSGGPALKSEGSLWRGATCFWRAMAGSRAQGYSRSNLGNGGSTWVLWQWPHHWGKLAIICDSEHTIIGKRPRRYGGIAIWPKLNLAHGRERAY